MKKVRVTVWGTLLVEINHSTQIDIEVPDNMDEEEIEQKGKDALEKRYHEKIDPILGQLSGIVGDLDIKEHNEEVEIKELGE